MDLVVSKLQHNSGISLVESRESIVESTNRLIEIAQSVTNDEITNAHYIGLEVALNKDFQSNLLNQIETIKGHEIGILEKAISSKRGEKRHLTLFRAREDLNVLEQLRNYPEILRDELIKLGQNLSNGCLKVSGVGSLSFKDKVAYFLVLDENTTEQIQNCRRNIVDALERRTGVHLEFEPYSPHITLGFIKNDVHPIAAKGEKKILDPSLTAQLNIRGIDFSALNLSVSALELPLSNPTLNKKV